MSSSLTNTTKSVKRFLIYFAIFVVIIIVADRIISQSTKPTGTTTDTINTDYPQPNKIFSQIPLPVLKNLPIGNSKAKVSKDALNFPQFPPVVYVYKLKPEQENFNEANQARTIAALLKLNSGETKTVNNVMYWETYEQDRQMSFDKVQRLWNYKVKYTNLSALITNNNQDLFINNGIGYLNSMDLNTNSYFNLDGSTCYFTYLDNQGNYSINGTANSVNSARLILNKRINLIIPVLQDLPTLTAPIQRDNYLDGIVNMTITGTGKEIFTNMIYFNYKVHDYENTLGVYPIISGLEAFDKIQNNQGYLYTLSEVGSDIFKTAVTPVISEFKITVANTKLIYIESFNIDSQEPWTEYLQPFYLFKGQTTSVDNKTYDFSFIVPALKTTDYKTP